jgi:alkylhydroperoxidase/carboxymuconolactone decarboxylase family protein YurZ
MKMLWIVVLIAGLVPVLFAQNTGAAAGPKAAPQAGGCQKCAANAAADTATTARPATTAATEATVSRTIPGTNETMLVGRVENLIPIGVLTVLGCEKCSAEAVGWALQQGSSFEDIDRALRTVAAMQKLDCFKEQFGPEVATRMQKPLAAAKEALEQARTRAAK